MEEQGHVSVDQVLPVEFALFTAVQRNGQILLVRNIRLKGQVEQFPSGLADGLRILVVLLPELARRHERHPDVDCHRRLFAQLRRQNLFADVWVDAIEEGCVDHLWRLYL